MRDEIQYGRWIMKRILMVVNVMDRGGVETLLMNIYRKINRNQYQFDFLTHPYDIDKKQEYEEEILSLGGRIYKAPRFSRTPIKYRTYINNLFRNHPEYEIVHAHNLDMAASVYMPLAKKYDRYLIAHAHNDSERGGKLRQSILQLNHLALRKYPDFYFACAQSAGEFFFGHSIATSENYRIIYNGIDVEQYRVNEETHLQYKRSLFPDVTGPIFGNVGRLSAQKNQSFLLDIFSEITGESPDARLVILGKGELLGELKEKAKRLHVEDRVVFPGSVPNASDYLKAFDVFLFPSLYEGLPLAAVEAQASGLPTLLSDAISRMVKSSDRVQFISLEASPKEWAHEALARYGEEQGNRHDCVQQVRDAGFDIDQISKDLVKFYEGKA